MGSDESHSNVSLIVRDKVTKPCPQTTTFEEKGEPKQIGTEVPLLTALSSATSRVDLRVRELCESRGGRPGLPSLINLQFLWT